jgi:eukaryotic-like serine/threonine-protein kinase
MKRLFNLILGALAMLAVALLSAFIAMRLAIHGREVKVPNLAGLTLSDAGKAASSAGLNLNLENRFYSADMPPGHILAQYPAPGATVRRQWVVRVTESLGPQQVSIPNVVGQSERTASINIRRVSLNVGTVAQIAAPGDPGIVLAQTPGPNASGVDRPTVSLLLSAPQDADASAFMMPSLAGLTLASASARAAAAGLHIVSVEDINAPTTPAATTPSPATATPTATPATSAPTVAIALAPGTVVAQSPAAGHRVAKGDPVHITLGH